MSDRQGAKPRCLDAAIELCNLGFRIVPIVPGQKRPYDPDWGGGRLDADGVKRAWGRHPDAELGIILGKGRGPGDRWLMDVEGDGRRAEESYETLVGGEVIETLSWTSK